MRTRNRFVRPRRRRRTTFEDLAEGILLDYDLNERRSKDRVELSIAHLARYFGGCRAADISTESATRYLVRRREEGAANQTVKNELSTLRRMLNLAHRSGRIAAVPYVPMPKVSNVREGFFSAAELERIIGELRRPLRPIVRFAAWTGWRRGEILPLRWSNVDFERQVVRLAPGTTKNEDGREFPFARFPALSQLIHDQRELTRAVERRLGRIVPWLFHRGGRQIRCMRKAWEGAVKRAGLEGAWFHDLRRTAVQNLERAGVPRSVAMKLTGHKTEEVYRRYAIADQAALAEGVDKLARLHGSSPMDARQHVIPLASRCSAS